MRLNVKIYVAVVSDHDPGLFPRNVSSKNCKFTRGNRFLKLPHPPKYEAMTSLSPVVAVARHVHPLGLLGLF